MAVVSSAYSPLAQPLAGARTGIAAPSHARAPERMIGVWLSEACRASPLRSASESRDVSATTVYARSSRVTDAPAPNTRTMPLTVTSGLSTVTSLTPVFSPSSASVTVTSE